MELREIQIIFSIFILSLIKMQVKALTLYEESQVPLKLFLNLTQRYFNIID